MIPAAYLVHQFPPFKGVLLISKVVELLQNKSFFLFDTQVRENVREEFGRGVSAIDVPLVPNLPFLGGVFGKEAAECGHQPFNQG
jgi:hypothetical protein